MMETIKYRKLTEGDLLNISNEDFDELICGGIVAEVISEDDDYYIIRDDYIISGKGQILYKVGDRMCFIINDIQVMVEGVESDNGDNDTVQL